jgi:glycosyltransferase involved in cell wall biosynthesis
MKIRYVYDQILPSRDTDTEQVLNTIAALARRGVEVELVVPRLPERPTPDAAALRTYYQVSGPFQVRSEPASERWIRPLQKTIHGFRASRSSGEADLVYTRNLHAVAFGLRFGHRVAYEHFRPWADQYPPIEPALRAMFRHPNFLGAILHSAHIVPSYARAGIPESRLLVAHNGHEPARMEPRLDARSARQLLELPQEGPLVVYAGRVHERKGLFTVLELARRLPDVRFLLVGSEDPEGAVERAARALTNVEVRPWQRFDATIQHLYAADVLITPPSLEPLETHGNTVLPMKLFSYLASGRALFAPEAPDTRELLVHGENAVLVPPHDPERQVQELRALLTDTERRQRIARGALNTAAALTWDARAEKLDSFLSQRLSEHAAGALAPGAGTWDVPAWLSRSARWLARRATPRA